MNFCDYDALSTYPTGSFSFKHKTNLDGKVIKTNKSTSFSNEIVKSFLNSEYFTYITLDDIILYRVFGSFKNDIKDKYEKPKGAKINGAFASTEFAESIIDAKIRFALDPTWKSTKMYEAKILVPKNTIISIGLVAPVTLKSRTVLSGQAEQILLPLNWPINWIIGYRRVTSRQLQQLPEYPYKPYEGIPNDIGCVNKSALFGKVCPICGSEKHRGRFSVFPKKATSKY